MGQDHHHGVPSHLEWLGNDVTITTEPGTGLVAVSWEDIRPGRRSGSRVLDIADLTLVIAAVTDIRDGLLAQFGPVINQARIDLGPFLDAVLERSSD